MDTSVVNSIEIKEDTVWASLEGDLDFLTMPKTKAEITAARLSYPSLPLTLDLREVKHIDSAGIAMLISFHKDRADDEGLNVVVVGGSQPHRVLKLGKFDTIFTLTPIESVPSPDTSNDFLSLSSAV